MFYWYTQYLNGSFEKYFKREESYWNDFTKTEKWDLLHFWTVLVGQNRVWIYFLSCLALGLLPQPDSDAF